MLIVHLYITFDLPYVHSLKGRRKILASIKERLKNKNMAVVDVSGEYPKEGALEVCFFAASQNDAKNKIESLQNLLQERFSDIEYNIDYEII